MLAIVSVIIITIILIIKLPSILFLLNCYYCTTLFHLLISFSWSFRELERNAFYGLTIMRWTCVKVWKWVEGSLLLCLYKQLIKTAVTFDRYDCNFSKSPVTLAVCSISLLLCNSSRMISFSLCVSFESHLLLNVTDMDFQTTDRSASWSPLHPRALRHWENNDIHFFWGGIRHWLYVTERLKIKKKWPSKFYFSRSICFLDIKETKNFSKLKNLISSPCRWR